MSRRTLVFDTSVVMDDPLAHLAYPGNDIVIPLTVVDELDNGKKKAGAAGRNARDFLNTLWSTCRDEEGRLVGAAPWDPDDPPALLVIHGLADDNVVAAHALRLSSALLADGRPHTFLPLSGVTHMTPQEVVAERLLTRQVDFLHASLGGKGQRQPLRPSSSPRA